MPETEVEIHPNSQRPAFLNFHFFSFSVSETRDFIIIQINFLLQIRKVTISTEFDHQEHSHSSTRLLLYTYLVPIWPRKSEKSFYQFKHLNK